MARDVRVRDYDLVLLAAADAPRSRALQGTRPVLQDQLHHLPREPIPLRLLGGDRGRPLARPLARPLGLLGAEDAGLSRGVVRCSLFAGAFAAGKLGGHAKLAEAQGVLRDEADLGRVWRDRQAYR